MLKIKQYLCRHDFEFHAKHSYSNQNLWKCRKCKVYCIQHYGLGTYYFHKTPHIKGWRLDLDQYKEAYNVQNR